MIKHNYGLAIMLYESNKCGKFLNLTFYGLSFSEPKRRAKFFQIFICGLSLISKCSYVVSV